MSIQRVVAAVLLVGFAAQAIDEPPELAALRKRYGAERTRVCETRDKAVAKAMAAYEAELGLLLANVRRQGDLDYVVAIQGELKRLETDRSAPTKPAPEPMKQLRAAQWGTRQAEDKADKQRDADLARLSQEYSGLLEALEVRLVASNRIEDAKEVRKEREGGMPRVPASVTIVEGPDGYRLVPFEDGQAIKDDGATLAGIPWGFVGSVATKTKGINGSRYRFRVSSPGYVYAGVNRLAYKESDWAGWERVATFEVRRGNHYLLLARNVVPGEYRTPQIAKAYTILVIPPRR